MANRIGEKKILKIAFDDAPRSIDPSSASSVYAAGIVLATYETLFEYEYASQPLKLALGLASEWPTLSNGGKNVTIKIRPDSRFSDSVLFEGGEGRGVEARDVAFSMLRHFDDQTKSQAQYLWRDLVVGIHAWTGDYRNLPEGIVLLDQHTLMFKLTRQSPQFLHTLTTAFSAILPVELSQSSAVDLRSLTVGSGPFRLVSLDSSRALLTRNENFRSRTHDFTNSRAKISQSIDLELLNNSQLPIVDEVVIEFISDSAARWVSFQNGDVHASVISDTYLDPMLESHSPPKLKRSFENEYSIHPYLASETIFLRIRMDDSLIGMRADQIRAEQNRMLRCAIRHSINWSERNKLFYGGDATLYSGIVPPFLPEFDSSRDFQPEGDVTRASEIINSLSEKMELPNISYGHTTSIKSTQNFDYFRSALVSAGYPENKVVGVRYASFGDFLNGSNNGRHQVTLTSWGLDYGDVENVLQLFYGPNASPGANFSNFQDDSYDRLYEKMVVMEPSKRRSEITNEMLDILAYQCAFSGSATRERVIISHKNFVAVPNHDATQIGRYFQFVHLN